MRRVSCILPALLQLVRTADLPGDACLPRDVINLVRGDIVADAVKACGQDSGCPTSCREALYALKQARCFEALSQSQRLQPRNARVNLAAMAGTWYALNPASNGVELIEARYDSASSTLSGVKMTGNEYVPAGKVSWEATPKGCRVVSSQYAGRFNARWDQCSLTMNGHNHMSIDFGAPGDGLSFVRALAPMLLEWDDDRTPVHGLAAAFADCSIPLLEARDTTLHYFLRALHHSGQSVVLDQILVLVPLLLIGWRQRMNDHPALYPAATLYAMLASARLAYLGYHRGWNFMS